MGGRGSTKLKATKATIIENMNETQIRQEISKAQRQIDAREKIINKNRESNLANKNQGLITAEQIYRNNYNKMRKDIENDVSRAKKFTEAKKQTEMLETRINNLQKALNEVKGTNLTQRQLREKQIKSIASTTKWNREKSPSKGETIISSGDYKIKTVEGTSFIYKNNKQISFTKGVNKAKAFVEILKKRGN